MTFSLVSYSESAHSITLYVYMYIYIGALRSRSLRDGSLSHKGRFATFVRSCSALRASKRQLKNHI